MGYLQRFLEERKNKPEVEEKPIEPWNKDFLIGYFLAETIWLTTLPTLSTSPIRSGKVIQVDEEDTKLHEELDETWFRDQSNENWNKLQENYRYLENKYLPKEVVYATFRGIETNEEFYKGIRCFLWNCDGCLYPIEKEDIIFEDNKHFLLIKFTYK